MAENRRTGEGETNWWGVLGAVAAGIGAIAAGAAVVTAAYDSKEKETTSRSSTVPRPRQPSVVEMYDRAVLAVDATPERCGGILILPRLQEIEYYSVDWRAQFSFPLESGHQAPDKFELTNAILGMSFWKAEIQGYEDYDGLGVIVKCDNAVVSTKKPRTGGLLEIANSLLEEINGEWKYALHPGDRDMTLANKLSRNNPYVGMYIRESYPDYEVTDYSDSIEEGTLLQTVRQRVSNVNHC